MYHNGDVYLEVGGVLSCFVISSEWVHNSICLEICTHICTYLSSAYSQIEPAGYPGFLLGLEWVWNGAAKWIELYGYIGEYGLILELFKYSCCDPQIFLPNYSSDLYSQLMKQVGPPCYLLCRVTVCGTLCQKGNPLYTGDVFPGDSGDNPSGGFGWCGATWCHYILPGLVNVYIAMERSIIL